MNCFLTGTDTDVGKTYVAALLVRALRRAGLDTVAMKPICCGDRDDAEKLREASGEKNITLDEVNPVWLPMPAAPSVAAARAGREVDLDLIRATFARLRKSHRSLLVEGAGGWLVPIARNYLVADLARDFALPVVVVARNRLGVLNHTLLTVESIRARGCECAGVILNNIDDPDEVSHTNRAALEELLDVPILFEIAQNQRVIELGIA